MQKVPARPRRQSPTTTEFILSTGLKGYDPADVAAGSWLGLDFGTSSVKALLVAADGAVRGARVSVAYPRDSGPGGEAEQDPHDYLAAAREAIARVRRRTGVALDGIGLAGQTPTIVLVDADGNAVRPALTWQDHRADAEARALEDELGPAEPLFGTRPPVDRRLRAGEASLARAHTSRRPSHGRGSSSSRRTTSACS